MAHARRFSGRRTPSLKTWLGQGVPAFGTDVTGPNGTFSAGLKVFGTPDAQDLTILRTRGALVANSDGSLAAETYQIALGIGLCTTEAALAGAVPLPFDNPEWDGWFVYQVSSFAQVGSIGDYTSQMEVDSKAMRKVPSGQVLFLSTQMFTGTGTGGILVNQIIQVRILLKTS